MLSKWSMPRGYKEDKLGQPSQFSTGIYEEKGQLDVSRNPERT
jgi:hypothetical protein